MAAEWVPTIVPFFGVLALTVCGGFTAISRRINALTRRVEVVERGNPIQPTRPTPPAQAVWASNQPAQWPVYPTTYQVPAQPYPYPSAPPILSTTAYQQQELR